MHVFALAARSAFSHFSCALPAEHDTLVQLEFSAMKWVEPMLYE